MHVAALFALVWLTLDGAPPPVNDPPPGDEGAGICELMPWLIECAEARGTWDCPDAPYPEMCDANVVTVIEEPDGSYRYCSGGPNWLACVFGESGD